MLDFEWSDAKISEKLKGMEMKDIFDIDLMNIPQPTNNKSKTKLEFQQENDTKIQLAGIDSDSQNFENKQDDSIRNENDDMSPFSQYMEQNQFLEFSLHEIVAMSRKENNDSFLHGSDVEDQSERGQNVPPNTIKHKKGKKK